MGGVRSAYEMPVTGPTGHKRVTMKEEILGVLESRGALLFKDIYSLLPGHSKPSIRGSIYKMVNTGILEKTPEGKYRLKESGELTGSESGEGESGAKTLEKRVEQIWVKTDKNMSHLCHLSKNLYNEANYLIRQDFIHNHNYIGSALDKMLNHGRSKNYTALPAQTSQQILRLLEKSWISFFKAIKDWRKNPDKYKAMPRLPGYKRKDGEHLLVFTNQQCEIREGYLSFPKKSGMDRIRTRLPDETDLREVRLIPKGVGYVVEIIYNKEVDKKEVNKERIGGIDLGAKNIVTIANNIGLKPIVVKDDGTGIKSIQQFFNKAKGKLQRIYSLQQGREPEKVSYGKAMKVLQEKREKKARDFEHKLSRFIIDWCREKEVGVLVIGYNKEWKQEIELGKKNNQSFVQIPFWSMIEKIKYKAEEEGIEVSLQEEGHTSKCSFFDDEPLGHHESYMGKRTSRGLFRTATGLIVNADLNAAYNIIKKAIPNAFSSREGGRIGGCGHHPVRINLAKCANH